MAGYIHARTHQNRDQISKAIALAVQTLADALEYTQKQLPDIALLDVNLGHGETSFDFAGMLLDRGVTVIFSTGFYDQRNVPAGMRHIVFLTKPFLAEQLEEALMEALK